MDKNVGQIKEEKTWMVNKEKKNWSDLLVLRTMQIKTRYNFSTHHIGKLLSLTVTSTIAMKENKAPIFSSIASRNIHWLTTLESNSAGPDKIKNWYSDSIQNIYTMENFTRVYEVEHKTMFTAVLFITEQIRNNSNACRWWK